MGIYPEGHHRTGGKPAMICPRCNHEHREQKVCHTVILDQLGTATAICNCEYPDIPPRNYEELALQIMTLQHDRRSREENITTNHHIQLNKANNEYHSRMDFFLMPHQRAEAYNKWQQETERINEEMIQELADLTAWYTNTYNSITQKMTRRITL